MLDNSYGEPLDLDAELKMATSVATEATATDPNGDSVEAPRLRQNPAQESTSPSTPDSAAIARAD
jgi:hypothetical protein